LKAMNSGKAPSPTDYSMAFFQVCWDVLKEDIMKVFHDFHARRKFEISLNDSKPHQLFPRKSIMISLHNWKERRPKLRYTIIAFSFSRNVIVRS
jgi:hypothetical protein